MKRYRLLVTVLLIILILSGCVRNDDPAKERETYSRKGDGAVVIAVPGPMSYMKEITGFYNGIQMAVSEFNESSDKHAYKISVEMMDDQGDFEKGMQIAQEIALRKDIVAVIGHWNTYITLPAARIYDDAGIVMLSPVVSNPDLVQKGYNYVFQNIANDLQMGRSMADYATSMNYKKVVVFYADNDYGRGLADSFETSMKESGGAVIDRHSDFISREEFARAYEKWKAFDYDAVFIADSMPHAGDFIKELRKYDSSVPIFSGDGLDMGNLSDQLGEAAEGIVVATMYNPERKTQEQADFIKKYLKIYNSEPDVWAVQGYESIMLLVNVMDEGQTTSPSAIADLLHQDKEHQGVLGAILFDKNGEMTNAQIYKKKIHGSGVEFLDQ